MEEKKARFDLSSSALHILAMAFMLLDHMLATVIIGQQWMTVVGRLAFPIFAFLLVEGFYHTHDIRKYLKRMLIFALVSEIPFDLMAEGGVFVPFHQNVMWTFLIALLGMWELEKVRKKENMWEKLLLSALIVMGTVLLGTVTFVDYFGFGVMMVYVFYFFRERKWWNFLLQFLLLLYINQELIGGRCFPITVGSFSFELAEQTFALFALIPIWLYRGRQGIRSKGFRWFCYAFYPAHCLILALIALYVL